MKSENRKQVPEINPSQILFAEASKTTGWTTCESPIGQLVVGMSEMEITHILFRDLPEKVLFDLPFRPCPKELKRAFDAFFRSTPFQLQIPLAPAGTSFQRAVWQTLCRTPPGHTQTYGDLASAVGRPGAARAVGQACGANPIPLLIPCHRVISSSGPGGFSAGLDLKKKLFEIEAIEPHCGI